MTKMIQLSIKCTKKWKLYEYVNVEMTLSRSTDKMSIWLKHCCLKQRGSCYSKWGEPSCNGEDVSAGETSAGPEYWCVWLIATSVGSNLKGGQWWMSFHHLLAVWCIMHPHLITEADEAWGDEVCPCPTHPDIGYINDCTSTPFISQLTGRRTS